MDEYKFVDDYEYDYEYIIMSTRFFFTNFL